MASLVSRLMRPHKTKVQRFLTRACERMNGTYSFSQDGEDLLLNRAFAGRSAGFYVDVGAYHPERFSNTFLFYLRGWHGLNIDAMPGSMEAFRRFRPRDSNVEAAISEQPATLTYHEFVEPSLNTFSAELARERDGQSDWSKLLGVRQIRTVTLRELLDAHVPPGQPIDFLSVDVEGMDLQVLRSNDWDRYRPEIVLAEDWNNSADLRGAASSELGCFLCDQGYRLWAKTVGTLFFRLGNPARPDSSATVPTSVNSLGG